MNYDDLLAYFSRILRIG